MTSLVIYFSHSVILSVPKLLANFYFQGRKALKNFSLLTEHNPTWHDKSKIQLGNILRSFRVEAEIENRGCLVCM